MLSVRFIISIFIFIDTCNIYVLTVTESVEIDISVFSSTKKMTKIFVDEAILICVNETKIVTIIQTISST